MAEEVNEPTEEARPAEAAKTPDETETKSKRIFFSFWVADDVRWHWDQPTSLFKPKLIRLTDYTSGDEVAMALSGSEEKRTPEEDAVSAMIDGVLADVERIRDATQNDQVEIDRLREETRSIISKLLAA